MSAGTWALKLTFCGDKRGLSGEEGRHDRSFNLLGITKRQNRISNSEKLVLLELKWFNDKNSLKTCFTIFPNSKLQNVQDAFFFKPKSFILTFQAHSVSTKKNSFKSNHIANLIHDNIFRFKAHISTSILRSKARWKTFISLSLS